MFILRAGADVDIFDPVIFEQYRSQDGPSIDKYGGKFIVLGGAAEKVEGDWEPKRLVILEFESVQRNGITLRNTADP